MQKVTLYSTPSCPFCIHAKKLLQHKGVKYHDIDVSRDRNLRNEMMQKANGRHTVPQIWIGKTHIGGCDELMALERAGKLDPMLQQG